MNSPSKMPRIKFNLSGMYKPDFGWISVDGTAMHFVSNAEEFYGTLGYTEEKMRLGQLPDEFVWAEFIGKDSKKSVFCLQAKLFEYLKTHSEKFNRQYADQYQTWQFVCPNNRMLASPDCSVCIMNRQQQATTAAQPRRPA